jgi:hypothetical protein
MKNLKISTLIFALTAFLFTQANAQDNNTDAHDVVIGIPEVALLDIESASGTSINLTPDAPTEAGDPISFASTTNTNLWLNYSSIVGSTTEPTRKVTTAITSGTVPGSMLLKVQAAADAGGGDGTVGTAAGEITLSGSAQDFITGIGSCYTGNGETSGHQLTYTLLLNPTAGSYANLDFDAATTVSITYTLTNN